MASRKIRHHTLDGMRGIAALMVALYHVLQRYGNGNFSGYLAVDLFFVLSGFVISYNYDDRLKHGLHTPLFLESRLVRLFPLYFVGWALGVARQFAGTFSHDPHGLSFGGLAVAASFNLFMLPAPVNEMTFPINGASWSLFFEMLICVLYAYFLFRLSSKTLFVMAVFALCYLAWHVSGPEYLNVGWEWRSALSGFARALFSFIIGMLIRRHMPMCQTQSRKSLFAIAVMVVLITASVPASYRAEWQLLLVAFAFPLLLIAGLRWNLPGRYVPLASLLGDLSYPIYAVHWPLIAVLRPLGTHTGFSQPTLVAIYLTILLTFSYLLARFYDIPVRRRMSAVLRIRSSAKPQFIIVSA
jgi:peptidoglycan/LPS O-acetylase OafA/YrhL